MKLFRHLTLFSAAGPAVFCQRHDHREVLHIRELHLLDPKAQMKASSVLLVGDDATNVSVPNRSTPRRHYAPDASRGSGSKAHTKRSDQLSGIDRRSKLTKSLPKDSTSSTDIIFHGRDLLSDDSNSSARLARRGGCMGWLCGRKDDRKLDSPHGPSPATSPSQSVMSKSPFADYKENDKKAEALNSGGSASGLSAAGSLSKQSSTMSAAAQEQMERFSTGGSGSSIPLEIDLTRSRGSDQLTRDFNTAYSAMMAKDGKHKPGVKSNLPSPRDEKPPPKAPKGLRSALPDNGSDARSAPKSSLKTPTNGDASPGQKGVGSKPKPSVSFMPLEVSASTRDRVSGGTGSSSGDLNAGRTDQSKLFTPGDMSFDRAGRAPVTEDRRSLGSNPETSPSVLHRSARAIAIARALAGVSVAYPLVGPRPGGVPTALSLSQDNSAGPSTGGSSVTKSPYTGYSQERTLSPSLANIRVRLPPSSGKTAFPGLVRDSVSLYSIPHRTDNISPKKSGQQGPSKDRGSPAEGRRNDSPPKKPGSRGSPTAQIVKTGSPSGKMKPKNS